ncbi:piezo-type mechanosensitive ion channel component isoform X3 [Planococcus citri]|uniref:piezo-type mechanosensitive ion channel component isoform X3 n=1 Tax=Planococcus citri TaxID=170843 RepID=UPI0031F7F633
MSKSFVSLCLLRIVYPVCLAACVCCRQDLMTAVFLLLLLYVPFVPLPTPQTMSGHTAVFLKLSFILSALMLLLQVTFQIVLISLKNYGQIIQQSCGELEKLFRHIGFIRYNSLGIWDCLIHIAPEVIALFASFFVYIICDRLNPKNPDADNPEQGLLETMMQPPETSADVRRSLMQKKALIALTIIGKYVALAMLCFASILVPSITSGLFYVIFLASITYWACYKDLNRKFAILCRLTCVIIFFYVLAIFCYQTEWIQELLPPNYQVPRYFGLQALHITNCSQDSRVYLLNKGLKWPSFALPFALLILYYLLIYESRLLLFVSALKKRLLENAAVRSPNESTPLIRGRESLYRRSANSTMSQDSHGSITVANTSEKEVPKTIDETNEAEESLKVDIMEYLMDAFITVIGFITRTSYIGTNIIMMTWSITYHSWLTFFLLLGAIILWMVPNQRQSMLRSSPFLIFYAEFLLLSQFLFGMDLNNDELPSKIFNVDDLKQLGFEKSDFPVVPLAVKTLFTTMFWITMRQYMQERQESRSTSTVAHMMAPVHVTVGTATAMGGDPTSKGGQIIQKFGERIRKLLTKFWIWIVTITLFAIGVYGSGTKMTLFRIMYTALALIFVVTFQLSWVIWRKMMYGFWLTVIIISMIILVMIYTFQFEGIPELWKNIGVGEQWQEYIGLEKRDTGELFFFLIIPTFFVIITVIQLKYFHKDFLMISDIKSRGTSTTRPKSRPSIMSDDEYPTQTEEVSSKTDGTPDDLQSPESSKTLVDPENSQIQPPRPSFHVFGRTPNVRTLQTLDRFKLFVKNAIEVLWLFLELHVKKFILVLVMFVSVTEVNAIHFGFVLGAVLAMMLNSKFQDIVIRLMSVSAAVMLLAEMIFQIDHFHREDWSANCTINRSVVTLNGSDWLGLYKVSSDRTTLQLLSGYIWIIVAVTIYVVVITRQKYIRHLKGRPLSRSLILFPRISYKDANAGVLSCIKYLFNYGFYRFGLEITFISIVLLIGNRLNVASLVYAFWLLFFMLCNRATLSKIWYFFNWFVAVTIPLQYVIIVGLPPELCFEKFFPKTPLMVDVYEYLFLPIGERKPDASKLIWDFLVLLFVTRQTKVFRIEYQDRNSSYAGGSNTSITHEMENPSYVNPIPDFISEKRSYLDIIKHGVLCSLLWISCAVVFLAGTHSVTLFSFGYVMGSFLILWQGNDFYLRPINTILKWWNRLLVYNVSVIFFKAFFQIPGCIFMTFMAQNACWMVRLLGITCLRTFALPSSILSSDEVANKETCSLASDPGGLGWDALCFVLLVFQKRLFSSHYFVRIVDEAKAMAVLAARGAELIEELSKKQIQKQQELEKTVLQKIKNKMDSIKAAQKKIQGIKSKEPSSHQEAVRSGDYYMFDDEESQNLIEVEDEDVEEEEEKGKTLGKLMESVMKTDLKHALKSGASSESKSSTSKPKSARLSKASSSDDVGDEDDDKDCSTCQYKSTDATTSKDVTDSLDESRSISIRRSKRDSGRKRTSFKREDRDKYEKRHEHDKGDSTDSDEGTLMSSSEEESNTLFKCWDSFVMYLKFAFAFIDSCMVSIIQFLNRKSRDYRYVIQALEKEKKTLKETKNLRIGMRILPDMKWQPVPAGLSTQRPKSPLKIEDFENQSFVASNQPTIVRLMLAVYHALMSHSDMVCYFAVFMLQIISPTLTSLPLPLMVFFWGTLSMPRPTKRFWVTIIAYTEFVVVLKNVCRSELFDFNKTKLLDSKPFHWSRMLGVEYGKNDAFYDLILLLAVFFHRSTLKSLGLWKSAEEFNKDNKATNLLNLNYVEPQRNSVISGGDSDVTTEITTINLMMQSEDLPGQSTDSYQNQTVVPQMKLNSRSLSTSKENVFLPFAKSINGFFSKMLDSKNRIADDVYAYMFFCDFCNIIVIIFGFSAFGAVKGDGGVTQYIEENKIPFAFLAMLILQFALIVIDRWLYLSKYISGKLVFQYLLVVGVHIWMFFILPAVTERQFNANLPPRLWYLIKCCYLLLSAYQIRSGYPTRILGNFLCKNYNLVNMVLFKIFMIIPFVYELRTLMDWIWTETSMTLADWIKMEDIFAQVFQLKVGDLEVPTPGDELSPDPCTRRAESKYPLPRSQKIAAKTKFLYGGGGLITLFTIIWFPLVLFALGDTVGEPNRPSDMAAKVQVSSYQSIYASSTSKITGLNEIQWEAIKEIYSSSASAQTFLSDYNPEDVGAVFLPHYSSSIWTIPPPEESDMQKELNNTETCQKIKVAMEWTLDRRSENPESPKTVSEKNDIILEPEECTNFLKVLQNKGNSTVRLKKLMPKFLKITSPGRASPIPQLMRFEDYSEDDDSPSVKPEISPFVDVVFQLDESDNTVGRWWNLAEDEPNPKLKELDAITRSDKGENRSIIIYTFNDKMFPPGLLSLISGKGIIGLYTTFVIVVGAYVKGYFTGTSTHIMFEDMPYVDRILQLCLDIFLVRERREFDLEEDLFAKLLFLYRSPETMIKWTRPPEDGGSDEY